MKREKAFDAVKMMREIRDKMSQELKDMNYNEQKRYIKRKLNLKPTCKLSYSIHH